MPADIPMLLLGIRDFVSRMDYHDFLPSSEEELIGAVERLLGLDPVEIRVVEHDDIIVGGIGMLYAPSIWNSDALTAEELFFWVSPDAPSTTALRLIRDARVRARQQGCVILTFRSLASSPDKLAKFYRKIGLQPVETVYMGPC